jgi:hypothetical protein
MTVYVDQYPEWLGVPDKWKGGGHLFATDLEELHAFAKSIGLRREWYQGEDFPHYDLTARKRKLAFQSGATSVAAGVIPEGVITRDPDSRPSSG